MKQKGFTFVELMVAIAVMLVVMAAATSLYRQSVQVSTTVTQQAEMQAELRGAANQLARDLNQAGTGIPIGGIPIPSVATGTNPEFACDSIKCYITVNNTFTQGVLYNVTPANGVGPNVVQASDAIIITYLDPNLNWSALSHADRRLQRHHHHHAGRHHAGAQRYCGRVDGWRCAVAAECPTAPRRAWSPASITAPA